MRDFNQALSDTVFFRTPDYFRLGSDNDDTLSLSRAWDWAMKNGGMIVPDKRKYYISDVLPTITDPMTFRGNGSLKTWIIVDPSVSGSVITTHDSYFGGSNGSYTWTSNGNTIDPDSEATGISLRGFTLLGDRSTPNRQDGIMHIDAIDNLDMDDVKIFCFKGIGWGFKSGPRVNAMIRESNLGHIYVRRCGDQTKGLPAVHIYTSGDGTKDSTNQVSIQKLDSMWPDGCALKIENDHAISTRYVIIHSGMLHGREDTAANPQIEPLMQVIGRHHSCDFGGMELNGIRDGQWGLVIDRHPNTLGGSQGCRFSSYIGSGSGTGNGIWVKYGRSWKIDVRGIAGTIKHLKIDDTVVGPIVVDSTGLEPGWVIDASPTALANLKRASLAPWQ